MCGSGFAVLVCGKFLMIELYRVLGDRWPANYFLVLYDIILGDRWPVKLVMDPSRLNSLPSLFFNSLPSLRPHSQFSRCKTSRMMTNENSRIDSRTGFTSPELLARVQLSPKMQYRHHRNLAQIRTAKPDPHMVLCMSSRFVPQGRCLWKEHKLEHALRTTWRHEICRWLLNFERGQ